VNALADPAVGKFINENFVSSFQKVATFKIVGGQKQGGNVASYFCAPDGRVLHVVPGAVNAETLLREAKWVVATTEKAMDESKGDGAKFKAIFRKAHAEKLKAETGLAVEPVTFDPPAGEQDANSALTYNDPSGHPIAPKLPAPPVDGPDVHIKAALAAQDAAAAAPGARELLDRKGGRWQLGNQGRADMLLAAHAMVKIEDVYATIFQDILGEKISTKPVEVVNPFPWVNAKGEKVER
jgi:hypothetical protein